MNIFNMEFVSSAAQILKEKCIGPNTIFKKDLVKDLGFDPKNRKNFNLGLNLVTAMFELGYFKDYKIITGKHGGIVHEPTFYRNVSQNFPPNFLENLFSILNEYCHFKPMPRNKIAKMLNCNLPEDQICNLITYAIQKKYIIGFIGKSGKNGGIIKNNKEIPKLIIPNQLTSNNSLFWNELNSNKKIISVSNG